MKPEVNNEYYNHLGDSWYEADNDPIAVLRAEQKTKNPWVQDKIEKHFDTKDLVIADIGCGGGFLTNYLAKEYSNVSGLDASVSSLEVAKANDQTNTVKYIEGDAYQLPFENNSCDVVCAMDFLEHVEDPQKVVDECARILKPNGLFFFHTFNRNFAAWLIVIKFMEWFMPNTPKNLHVLHLFIKPVELEKMMAINNLTPLKWVGLGPCFNFAFFKSIFKRRVTKDFRFKTSDNLALGYMGYAKKGA